MVSRGGSIHPCAFPDEEFELYSIPAHDRGGPEILLGSEIGSSKQIVQPGDVMLSKIIPHIRRVRVVGPWNGRRQVASGEWIVFRGDDFDPNYLRHFLTCDGFHGQFMNTVAGVGGSLVRARPEQVKGIAVPLPPLNEQRRIAATLDYADAIRAKRRQVLAHLDALTQSTFRDMFVELWPTAKISDLASTTSGGTPDRSVSEFYGGGIPWVKSGELHAGLVTETEESISPLGLASSSAKLLPAGTVLVAMYGATAGLVGQLGLAAATNQAICAINPGPKLESAYLIAALRSMTASLVSRRAGGAQPNLSQGTIRSFEVPVPPLAAQHQFAESVRAIDTQRAVVRRALGTADELFASVQSRAFRGEL
jgi:type I restriction enzyme S subunit